MELPFNCRLATVAATLFAALTAAPAAAQVQPVDSAARTQGKTTEVLVSNTTPTAVPAVSLTGRRQLEVQNLGPNDIFCTADGSTPVVAKARKVAASGGVLTLPIGANIVVTCIAQTQAQATGAATIATEVK
jgi:hypothetical protein